MGAPEGFVFFVGLFLFLVGLLITAALLRWFFRINKIIELLEDIVHLLEKKKP